MAEGDLSRTEPVWSPDGRQLTFAWKDASLHPGKLTFAAEDDWRGNIWVITPGTGTLKQVTFIQGAARNLVWSLDGQSLTFFTHNGQIGLVAIEQPDVIRQLVGPGLRPLFGFTVPLP